MVRNIEGKVSMKLSVIVPVYNVEPYLRKCLESLVNQTLEDMEIIVVNDGSPDDSQKIIDEFVSDYPKRVIGLIKENGGQASARNLALQYAKGQYIGFVDGDDWVDTEMFETMYNKALSEQADIVICNTMDHYDDHIVYHRQSDVGKLRKCGSVCNKIFRRDMIGSVRFPEGLWYEDLCFGVKLLMQTEKIAYCEEHFYHALNRQGSTMNNNNSRKNLDMLTVMTDIVDYMHEHNLDDKYGYDLEYMMIEHILLTSINRVSEQKNPDKEKIIRELRNYVLKYYPNFRSDKAFKEFKKNQRIIAVLNGYGLHKISKILLFIKKKISRG